jgi:hypothetical protein
MKQQRIPGSNGRHSSLCKMLEGYDTGTLLSILSAMADIFKRRGLELTFTTRAASPTAPKVVESEVR